MALFFKRKINKNAPNPSRDIRDFSSNVGSYSGTDATAFACIDRIASEFASLNYAIYNQDDKQRAKKHPLYSVLKEPNLDDRHFNFFYQSAIDYFTGKGCFWNIKRYQGEVIGLFRLNPAQVMIQRNDATMKRQYLYNGKIYSRDDVVYIPSRFDYSTLNGGKSIFDAMSGAFKTSNSLENYAINTFKNGVAGKRLVVDFTNLIDNPTPSQIRELKDQITQEYAGIENAGRPLFKRKGIDWNSVDCGGATNQTQQLAENRKIQVQVISQLFGVPLAMLTNEKIENLENIFTMLSEFAIRPIATQFQEAINSLLDEDKYFFEFDYNGIMKVSLTQRVDSYIKQIQGGILSLDDVRAKENLPPIEAGDTHFMPVNMMPWNEETKKSYMAKQKIALQEAENGPNQETNPTDPDSQHMPQGDDKQ